MPTEEKSCNNCGYNVSPVKTHIDCKYMTNVCASKYHWVPRRLNVGVDLAKGGEDKTVMSNILDSGNRTQFQTGAVRDMHQGKGRCDLLPPNALLRLARHFETGSLKYGDRNWELGIPCHSFADSGMRHLLKYMAGNTDEDHLIAAIWNLMCLAETEQLRPEMMDIPSRDRHELLSEKPTTEIDLLQIHNDVKFWEGDGVRNVKLKGEDYDGEKQ